MSHDHELAQFLAGEPIAIDRTLRTLPATANLAHAVAAVLRLIDHPHWLVACGGLPVRLIRGVLAAPVTHPAQLFLQLAIPGDAKATVLKTAWQRAVRVLGELAETTHALDAEPRRRQLEAIAKSPLLRAIQGFAANSSEVSIEMLVVLAIDGSDGSIDALIPHLDLALGSRDARLERLALLRPFARTTPALDALFVELDGALAGRRRDSPARAFATELGIDPGPQFYFSFRLMSVQLNELGVRRFQGSVHIDSRADAWFRVELCDVHGSADRTRDRTTRFDRTSIEDQLSLGRCDAIALPTWLQEVATSLRFRWDRFLIACSDPAARTALDEWLIVKLPPRSRR